MSRECLPKHKLDIISPSKTRSYRQRTYFSMALITPPLAKSRPYPFLPTRRLNILNGVSLALNVHSSYPKLYELRTYGRHVKIAFFGGPINKRNDKYNGTAQAMAEGGGSSLEQEQEEWNCRRILLSDVIVKRERKVFWGRKWNPMDVGTASVVLAMHLLSLFAPFCFNWSAFWVAFGLYVITGLLGITLSFHRNLSHRSFKLPKWLEYLFAYCGVLALQGNPIDWVSTHRYHHQFCDSQRDPHSPIEGFWFSHMSWLFDTNSVVERCGGPNNVGDLEKQPFYKFIQTTYILHPFASAVLLYACGGFPFLVWGMGVRTIWVYHITWLVNSACHVWGKQAWNTGDLSRNNWWVAILAFGEGWHNNHHAFEYSARHGLEWWQPDVTWYVVRLLQVVGLATEVKLPTQLQKQRMAALN